MHLFITEVASTVHIGESDKVQSGAKSRGILLQFSCVELTHIAKADYINIHR